MIQAHYSPGRNLYAILFDATGKVWNGAAFVSLNPSMWDNYAINLTEIVTGIYQATIPAGVPATTLHIAVYERATTTPTPTDLLAAVGELHWGGSSVLHLANIIAAVAADMPATKPWTYTLTDNLGNPIAGCRVDVYADPETRHLVARAVTDTWGIARFWLDPGTYYIRRYLPGWTFTDPDVETV